VCSVSEISIVNGLVATPDGASEADVLVRDGLVVDVCSAGAGTAGEVVDARGAWVGPGLVDLHAHLREPGQEHKEDIASGSAAAAAGGYTAVVAMPNTDPAIDRGHLARFVSDRGRDVGLVDVQPSGTISSGRAGLALAHLDELWTAGVRVFTDDGDSVADAGLLRRAMEYIGQLGGVVAQHAVDSGLAGGGQMHEGRLSSRLGMHGIPALAEELTVARDLALARLTGCRYHVQHVSTAGAVGLIEEAKDAGTSVTAEVTPHHLAYDDSVVAGTDPVFKMMPPLRSGADVAALRTALASGVIDAVATDHAPHADHEKDVPFEEAPFGVTGLEWAAAVTNTVAGLDIVSFFERMSVSPARIASIADHGRWTEPGVQANLVVFDASQSWTPGSSLSKSSNSPHLGRTWSGAVRLTILRGRVTHAMVGVGA
jgi:dihydroorotase